MTPPTKFAHVVFATHRYDQMIDWYEAVFEAKIQSRGEQLCFMSYDDEHHRHAFYNLGPALDELETLQGAIPTKPGLFHLAYTWDDLASLVDTYKRVRDKVGARPFMCIAHGPTLSMYYADPDGNQLEFQIDLLEPDAANEFIHSPAFAANPVGEPFDPEELARRIDAQEPVDDLVFRSDQDAIPLERVSR
jgi:catechol-2,3-dioxygenase